MKPWLLTLFFAFFSPPFLCAAVQHRADLKDYSASLCDPSPKSLQDKVIPDAQVELAFVKTDREVKAVAMEFAEENHHRGFAFGTCPDGRTWIVSTPAPETVLSAKKDGFEINRSALKLCRETKVSVIEDGTSLPRTVASGLDRIAAKGISAISVSCLPRDKADAGPELWALLIPRSENVTSQKSIQDLLGWINDTRKNLKLPELKPLPKLDETAREAANSKTLEHPHALLLSKKDSLAQQKIQLLGENRAISSSFTGLADLFWNSPEHRSLLLNAKANAIGYALKDVHGQRLLVLVLARAEP